MTEKDWIVIVGQPIDSIKGGGFEFFGPYTEDEAFRIKSDILNFRKPYPGTLIVVATQLLKVGISSS